MNIFSITNFYKMSTFTKFDASVFQLFVVDAFSKIPFSGNNAAVCLLPYRKTVAKNIKQKIAAEMNLPVTAFITMKTESDSFEKGSEFGMEWFTPLCEIPLCGNATLASAFVLFQAFSNQSAILKFKTASGILHAKQLSVDRRIEIDLPVFHTRPVNGNYEKLVKAVVGTLSVQDVVLSESRKLLIRLSDDVTREDLEKIRIKDDELLTAASDAVGVIVTCNGSGKDIWVDEDGNKFDFLSRYFSPWIGISEDPVTARQCSPRGGNLYIRFVDDRAYISGNAVIVIQGQIL